MGARERGKGQSGIGMRYGGKKERKGWLRQVKILEMEVKGKKGTGGEEPTALRGSGGGREGEGKVPDDCQSFQSLVYISFIFAH